MSQTWMIDTDPGVDDAWAILMMLAAPEIELLGLSVVAGNVGFAHTLRNARRLAAIAGRELKVYAGASEPLIGGAPAAAHVHGEDGFGEAAWDQPLAPVADTPAALALIEASRRPGGLNLLALGPLTNLALAIRLDPGFAARLQRVVVMGGAVHGRGNTPDLTAEFNIGFDPEAAAIVFRACPRIELVDWELTVASAPATAMVESWLAQDSPRARLMHTISRRTAEFVRAHRGERWPWADPLAAAVALDPACVQQREWRRVEVMLSSGWTRGMTVVDWQDRSGLPAQTEVVTQVDAARVHARMNQALG